MIAMHFSITVLGIQAPGSLLLHGGVEVQRCVTQLRGTFLQGVEYGLAEPASLEGRVYAHAFDLRPPRRYPS